MCNVSVNGDYDLTAVSDFHLLQGETINSMLPLSNGRYLCAVNSGSLQLIDINTKKATLYAPKFKGKHV